MYANIYTKVEATSATGGRIPKEIQKIWELKTNENSYTLVYGNDRTTDKTKILKIINTLLQCKEKYCNSLQAHRVV